MGIKEILQGILENKNIKISIIAIATALVIMGIMYAVLVLPGNYRLQGDSYMVSGLYQEAIQAYDKALWFHPDEGVVLSHKGDALLRLSAYDDAFVTYEHAARSKEPIDWSTISQILESAGRIDLASQAYYYLAQANPTSIQVWYKLGNLQSQLMEYERAAASYDQVTRLDPESAPFWLLKAETLAKIGYYLDAILAYERVISIEPDLLIAYLRKADMQEERGDIEGALATIDAALAVYPESVQGLMHRYNLLIQLDRYPEAVRAQRMANEIQERYVPGRKIEYQDFSEKRKADTFYQHSLERQINALSKNAEDAEVGARALLMRAYLANLEGSYAQAMRLAKQALALNPPTSIATAAFTNLGHAYVGYREYDNAELAFLQAIEKDNKNQVAFAGLAYALYKMGQYPQTIPVAEQALALDIGDAESWLIKGLALADNGNPEEGYLSLRRADALKPQNAETLNKLTAILYERGEIEDALSLANQVISLSSDNTQSAQAWFYRGWILLQLKEYDTAYEAFNRALELEPKNAYNWLGKGQVYEVLGKTNDALYMYEQAQQLRPGDPVLEEARMRAETNRGVNRSSF